MNQTQGTQDPKFTFGKLLVGFVLLEVALVALSAFWSGCAAVDPDAVYDIYTNIVVRIPDSSAQGVSDVASQSGGAEESTSSAFAADWRYGGFNGGKAAEDASCQIKAVSMSGNGVTFKLSGSWWGATHDNPTMRCCAFFKDGSGKWVGGFWEWGSPDRTYRGFENIDDGYNGWDSRAFRSAKEYAFCICSKDGRKRSNIVYTKGN